MSVSPSNFGLQGFAFPVVAGGSTDYPAIGNVLKGIAYNFGTQTGNLALPGIGDVRQGVQFGTQGTQYTGTLFVPLPPPPPTPQPTPPPLYIPQPSRILDPDTTGGADSLGY